MYKNQKLISIYRGVTSWDNLVEEMQRLINIGYTYDDVVKAARDLSRDEEYLGLAIRWAYVALSPKYQRRDFYIKNGREALNFYLEEKEIRRITQQGSTQAGINLDV